MPNQPIQSPLGKIRESIVDAILAVPCRPYNVNVQNMVARQKKKELPLMEVFLLSEVVQLEFAQGGGITRQLIQVNLHVDKGTDLEILDGYKSSFQSHFISGSNIGELQVASPPEVLIEEETDVGFVSSLTFAMDYYYGG